MIGLSDNLNQSLARKENQPFANNAYYTLSGVF
jgi:hypothetical protein